MKRALMLLSLAVAVSSAGCGDPKAELPIESWREVQAPPHGEELVARAAAEMGVIGLPETHWYGGAGLDCEDGLSWRVRNDGRGASADAPGSQCIRGAHGGSTVAIAANPSPIVESTITHELGHVLSEQRGGGGCHDHDCPIFAPGGDVERAFLAISAGM